MTCDSIDYNDDLYKARLKTWLCNRYKQDPEYINKIDFYISQYNSFYDDKQMKSKAKEAFKRHKFIYG